MIKHYYCFNDSELLGSALNADNWDVLRGGDSGFAIEKTKDEWKKNCVDSLTHRELAQRIIEKTSPQYKKWISFGCGKGMLEWNIVDIDSTIKLGVTDYSEKSKEVLSEYFGDKAYAFRFDMLSYDSYERLRDYDIAVMCRVSTEFKKSDLRGIFERLYNLPFKEIVFVDQRLLTPSIFLEEIFCHLTHKISGRKEMFAGYMYSKRDIEGMFGRWKIKSFSDDEYVIWVLKR